MTNKLKTVILEYFGQKMVIITFIYIYFLSLFSITIQHQCVKYCTTYLTFDETFDTLPVTCNETYQNVECYSYIGIDYIAKSIQIKFGEQSTSDSSPTPDDFYVSHETEMWHEKSGVEWTILRRKCYHGDLCDFQYVKTKLSEIRKLTTNYNQFQQTFSSVVNTTHSDSNNIRCLLEDGSIVTCKENIKSCSLTVDNIYANTTQQGCSTQSDEYSGKELGIKEETSHYLNGKVDMLQSSVEYVCKTDLCNGKDTYRKVIRLLMEYHLIRDDTPIGPVSSAIHFQESIHKLSLLIPLLVFSLIFYQ